jgi:nicotinamide N-methyltransferase
MNSIVVSQRPFYPSRNLSFLSTHIPFTSHHLSPHLPAAMANIRRPSVAASPAPVDRILKSRFSDQSLAEIHTKTRSKPPKTDPARPASAGTPVINISPENLSIINNPSANHATAAANSTSHSTDPSALADELDYITITAPAISSPSVLSSLRADKASRILGIKHRRSMEPIPASARNSIVSTRSARDPPPMASFVPTLPLTSLYVVSGLPKSPHTWTLADPDSVMGLHHSDGAVSRWWRPEVLGSTVSPGAGGGKKKKRGKNEEVMKGAGALSKQEVGKMLSKALKVS